MDLRDTASWLYNLGDDDLDDFDPNYANTIPDDTDKKTKSDKKSNNSRRRKIINELEALALDNVVSDDTDFKNYALKLIRNVEWPNKNSKAFPDLLAMVYLAAGRYTGITILRQVLIEMLDITHTSMNLTESIYQQKIETLCERNMPTLQVSDYINAIVLYFPTLNMDVAEIDYEILTPEWAEEFKQPTEIIMAAVLMYYHFDLSISKMSEICNISVKKFTAMFAAIK